MPLALNKNNSAVKRIMREARELANDPSTEYTGAPLEDDIFEWHCTLRGPAGTDFEGGLYHFRILLPAEYPFRPPAIMLLTPNGRFELNTKICISFTNYHEESWQPAWGVRTAIIGLQGFFPLKGETAAGVGSIEYPSSERKRLATLSRNWVCPHCKRANIELLPETASPSAPDGSLDVSADASDSPSVADSTVAPKIRSPVPNLSGAAEATPENAHAIAPDEVLSSDSTLTSNVDGSSRDIAETVQPPQNVSPATTTVHRSTTRSTPRAPFLLDATICVLFALVIALAVRRVF